MPLTPVHSLLSDLSALLLTELDIEALREMILLLDQALDRSDLLPCLDAMIAKAAPAAL